MPWVVFVVFRLFRSQMSTKGWDSTVIFRLFLCQKQLILLGEVESRKPWHPFANGWDSTVIFRLFLCQRQLIPLEKWKARGNGFDGLVFHASFVRGKRGGGKGGILVCGPQQKERTTYCGALRGFPNYVGKALFCVLWYFDFFVT